MTRWWRGLWRPRTPRRSPAWIPSLSRELHVAGLPAWRVLADAAAASGVEYDADLLYDQAPYGVGYFVATWLAR